MDIHELYPLILNIFFMIIILGTAYIIYNPILITKYLKHKWNLKPDKESLMHENVTEELFSVTLPTKTKKITQKIYYYTKPRNNGLKLIIDIPGGAFLVAATNLNIYFSMTHLDIDVVSLEYPVLIYATAEETLLFLEEAMHYIIKNHMKKYFLDNDEKLEIYLVTASAGSYFGTKLINRGKFRKYITKFIGINGYYGHKTMSNKFLSLIESCYLTKTLWQFDDIQQRKYDCSPIDNTIQSMMIIGKQDNLKESSINFCKLTGSHLELCTYEGDHTFYLKWNTPETKKIYKDLEIFLIEI